jgi:hypothetical protein
VVDPVSVLPRLQHEVCHHQGRLDVFDHDVEPVAEPGYDLDPPVELNAAPAGVDRRREPARAAFAGPVAPDALAAAPYAIGDVGEVNRS